MFEMFFQIMVERALIFMLTQKLWAQVAEALGWGKNTLH